MLQDRLLIRECRGLHACLQSETLLQHAPAGQRTLVGSAKHAFDREHSTAAASPTRGAVFAWAPDLIKVSIWHFRSLCQQEKALDLDAVRLTMPDHLEPKPQRGVHHDHYHHPLLAKAHEATDAELAQLRGVHRLQMRGPSWARSSQT